MTCRAWWTHCLTMSLVSGGWAEDEARALRSTLEAKEAQGETRLAWPAYVSLVPNRLCLGWTCMWLDFISGRAYC